MRKMSLAIACALLWVSPAMSMDRGGGGETCDPRDELVSLLGGANVDGFLFALGEEEAQTVSSLTNGAAYKITTLKKGDKGLVLRYAGVKDHQTNTTKTYKSEVIRDGDKLTLRVTDLETNSFEDQLFPAPGIACEPAGQFENVNDCLKEFDCTSRGSYQCEANRTCHHQVASLICCFTDGTAISIHLLIRPNSVKCALRDLIPDVEGLVLSPN